MLNVILFGATGATGRAIVDILLGGRYASDYVNHPLAIPPESDDSKTIKHVTAITRRKLRFAVSDEPQHPFGTWNLQERQIDFDTISASLPQVLSEVQKSHGAIDVAFCAHGTTMNIAGSEEEYLRIDKTMTLELAREAKEAGVKHFSLVSATGADSSSRFFYTRTKGQIVDEIKALGFERLSVFKPGLLITRDGRTDTRAMEPLESFVQTISPCFDWLAKTTGWECLKPAQSITVEDLAAAMIANALRPSPTNTGYEEYDTAPDIIALTHKANQ